MNQVADMKNHADGSRNANSACAGQFIGNHIEVGRCINGLELISQIASRTS